MKRLVALLAFTIGCGGGGSSADALKALKAENDALRQDVEKLRTAANDLGRRASAAELRAATAEEALAKAAKPVAPEIPVKIPYDPAPTLTAKAFEVEERPDDFVGKCMFFDKFWVSGDVEFEKGEYVVAVKDDREKRYTGFSGLKFVCSKEMANKIRAEVNANMIVNCKILCAMTRVQGRNDPVAEVYKLEIYNVGGKIAKTIELPLDSGAKQP